ncbi:MAG: PhoH family protein [Nitrospirae bacterium]|nr:PhoH family protein [Nitrospirota bacterium]
MAFDSEKELPFLFTSLEKNLKLIEEALGISASYRGNRILLKGADAQVRAAEALIHDLRELSQQGYSLRPEDIRFAVRALSEGEGMSLKELFLNNIPVSSKRRFIIPKTENQKKYLDSIKEFDIVFGIGPAGTGKTYLAMAMAVNALLKKEVSRIVLARPAIEAGEKLGFLPGDIQEKVNPYLRPLYDALYDMMEAEKVMNLMERGVVEIAPLAFMRGRTLNDAFVILDEAQNTTTEQMKMFLTRLGFNSKAVITGDVTQIDLPSNRASGLVEVMKILEDIKGITFVSFSERDVVRHKLVQAIIKAYERYENRTIDTET